MDWINEKIEAIRERVQNMSLKTSLMMYLLFGMGICFLCSWVTETICFRWISILQESTHYTTTSFIILRGVYRYSPYVYMAVTGLVMGICFYRKRLQTPFNILERGQKKSVTTDWILRFPITVKMKWDSYVKVLRKCVRN